MPRVLDFQPATSRRPLLSPTPTSREAVHQFVNDLQILALERPEAARVLARLARDQAERFRQRTEA